MQHANAKPCKQIQHKNSWSTNAHIDKLQPNNCITWQENIEVVNTRQMATVSSDFRFLWWSLGPAGLKCQSVCASRAQELTRLINRPNSGCTVIRSTQGCSPVTCFNRKLVTAHGPDHAAEHISLPGKTIVQTLVLFQSLKNSHLSRRGWLQQIWGSSS